MAWKRGRSDLFPQENDAGTNSHRQWVFKTEDGCSSQTVLCCNTYSCPMYGILPWLHNFSVLHCSHLSNGNDGHFVSCGEDQVGQWRETIWHRGCSESRGIPFLRFSLQCFPARSPSFVIPCLEHLPLNLSLKTHFKKANITRENVSLHTSRGWTWETDSTCQEPVTASMIPHYFGSPSFFLSLSLLPPSGFLKSPAKSFFQILNFGETQTKTICSTLTLS